MTMVVLYEDIRYVYNHEHEIVDEHTLNKGRVLTKHKNDILVMWFNNEHKEVEDISNISISWESLNNEAIIPLTLKPSNHG